MRDFFIVIKPVHVFNDRTNEQNVRIVERIMNSHGYNYLIKFWVNYYIDSVGIRCDRIADFIEGKCISLKGSGLCRQLASIFGIRTSLTLRKIVLGNCILNFSRCIIA